MKVTKVIGFCLVIIVILLFVVSCTTESATSTEPQVTETTVAQVAETTEDLPTIRVGIPLPLTGVLAESAKEMKDVINMYLKSTNGTLGGLPAEVLIEDTETLPETVITKTEKLINDDEVHFLSGPMLSAESAAMTDSIVRGKIAHASMAGSSTEDIKLSSEIPYIARFNYGSFGQGALPFGKYAYEKLGYRKIAMIGQDYVWGWETLGSFQLTFEKAGGKIVQKLWSPIGTTDYGPFVTELDKDVDAIWATLIGTDVPRFVKAYQDYGLKDKIPLITSEDFVGEDAMRYFGDEALGLIGASYTSTNLDRQEEQDFVNAYNNISGKNPSFWGDSAYNGVLWVDRALWKLRDDGIPAAELPQYVRDNPEEFIKAIKSVKLEDAPSGPMWLDDSNSVVRNVYLCEIVKKDGKITNEVIHTLEAVSPFYEYSLEEFFELPALSRDYPPVAK